MKNRSLTLNSKDLFSKYYNKRDGNYIYYDNIEDCEENPAIKIDIEDIISHNEENLFLYLKEDFWDDVFEYPSVIIHSK